MADEVHSYVHSNKSNIILIFSLSFTVVLRFQNIYTDVNFTFTEPFEGNDEYFYSFCLLFQCILN